MPYRWYQHRRKDDHSRFERKQLETSLTSEFYRRLALNSGGKVSECDTGSSRMERKRGKYIVTVEPFRNQPKIFLVCLSACVIIAVIGVLIVCLVFKGGNNMGPSITYISSNDRKPRVTPNTPKLNTTTTTAVPTMALLSTPPLQPALLFQQPSKSQSRNNHSQHSIKSVSSVTN
uniref:dynactin-associated protein-like n=1 Tax=Odobenus rosmarus divergens TaxID=9708 RepID=UPI00063CA0DD|nr:PREDICTED: dynactin-associated protein-like [Odobenus rosmarus divergens]